LSARKGFTSESSVVWLGHDGHGKPHDSQKVPVRTFVDMLQYLWVINCNLKMYKMSEVVAMVNVMTSMVVGFI